MRIALLLLLTGSLVCAQQEWKAATTLTGVDMAGLTAAQKAAALKILREEGCACGCNMKIAECRVKDPACAVSRNLANTSVKELKAGKSAKEVAGDIAELAKKGPGPTPVLDEPVSISIAGDPSRGPANAKITLVEFSDFQCPYCAAAALKVNALIAQYPNDIKLVFKQFPLDIHPQARIAAQASLAAAAQNKFWELHDKMFANFRQLTRERIVAMAKDLGLDMQKFNADLDNAQVKAVVSRELQEGLDAGVSGTPSFFVNGKKFNGPVEASVLKPIFDKELGR